MRHSSPSQARRRANIGRRSRGMVNTYCRCATGARIFSNTVYVYVIADGRRDMQTLLARRLLGA